MFQVGRFDADTVNECAVGRAKITKKTLRRRYFENAVMSRKKTVVRQAKLSILASPDHKCVVLIKCEVASGLRTGNDVQGNTHQLKFAFWCKLRAGDGKVN